MSDSPTARRAGATAIYYCPFCAEEDLWPVEEPAGSWSCRACARQFTVQLVRIEEERIPGRIDPSIVDPARVDTASVRATPVGSTPVEQETP